MPRLSANLGFLWPDRPLIDRIGAAARAGFEAVEMHWPYDVPPEAIREACLLHNVKLLSINSPLGDQARGEFGLAAVPDREAEFRKSFDIAVDYAQRSGAAAIHVMAGLVLPEDHAAGRVALQRNLAYAGEAAGDLTLLLEALNRRNNPGYFYSTVEDVAAVIADQTNANLKLMFDVYHVGVEQGDVLVRLDRFLPLIGHIQIAGVPDRAEPHLGEINYRYVLGEIDRLGYDGFVGCEYRPQGDTDAGLLRWQDLRATPEPS